MEIFQKKNGTVYKLFLSDGRFFSKPNCLSVIHVRKQSLNENQ